MKNISIRKVIAHALAVVMLLGCMLTGLGATFGAGPVKASAEDGVSADNSIEINGEDDDSADNSEGDTASENVWYRYDEANTTLYLSGTDPGEDSGYTPTTATYHDWTQHKDTATKIVIDDVIRPTTTSGWFKDFEKVIAIDDLDNLKTDDVTNMSDMFTNCQLLKTLDVSGFDTSKVTDMSNMFWRCYALTSLDVSKFNTEQVTDMTGMFASCSSLTSLDVSSFKISGLGDEYFRGLYHMFSYCGSLTTIYAASDADWSTTEASSQSMFDGCLNLRGGNGTIYKSLNPTDKTYAHIDGGTANPGYFTSNDPDVPIPGVATIWYKYDGTTLHLSKSQIDSDYQRTTDSAVAWIYEYDNRDAATGIVIEGDIENSSDDIQPFTTAEWFAGLIKVASISGLENLDTSNVTDMSKMFEMCYRLTSIDLSIFDTSKVTKTEFMFADCIDLKTIYAKLGTDWSGTVRESGDMFYQCQNLKGGNGTKFKQDNPKDATYARIDGGTYYPGYFTVKDMDAVTVTFDSNGGTGVPSQTIEKGGKASKPDNPTKEGCVFKGWYKGDDPFDFDTAVTESIKLEAHWVDTRVYFWYDRDKAMLHLSGDEKEGYTETTDSEHRWWDYYLYATKVVIDNEIRPTTTSNWFNGFYQVPKIEGLEKLDTSEVVDMNSMFEGCSNLTSLDLSSFDITNVMNMSEMFIADSNLERIYVAEGTDWSDNAASSENMFSGCIYLVGGNGTPYDPTKIDATYARVDGGEGSEGYFTVGVRVSFNSKGGTRVASQTVKKGGKATKPEDPTRDGYIFNGWYGEGATKPFDFENTEITDPITLEAHWTEKTDPTPAPSVAPGATAEEAEAAILAMTSDADPAGSMYAPLKAKSTKQTKKSVTLKWSGVGGAVRYAVYGNRCGAAYGMQKLSETGGTKIKFGSIAGAKVKKGTYYKFIVVAIDGNNRVVSTSKVVHAASTGGKVGNHKKVTVKKAVTKKAKKLKAGKTLKLKAKAVKKKLKVKKHTKAVRYESSNPAVATVTSSGKVRGVAKGSCVVYAYTQNGVSKAVKVTVK